MVGFSSKGMQISGEDLVENEKRSEGLLKGESVFHTFSRLLKRFNGMLIDLLMRFNMCVVLGHSG